MSIVLNWYGTPEEQFKQDDQPIDSTKFNGSICHLAEENQLMVARLVSGVRTSCFTELVTGSKQRNCDRMRPKPVARSGSGLVRVCQVKAMAM